RGTLTLHFREPVHGDIRPRVVCRGTLGRPRAGSGKNSAPSTEQRDWFCPGLYVLPGDRLAQVPRPPRKETIELRCQPQLRVEDWQPGDFRVAGAETEADGTYHLTLTANGVPGASTRSAPGGRPETAARPSAILRTHGV